MSGRLPLHVLTGFLGSGKTTLLNRVLTHPAWADSAILINEIGAVSIDHHLVERIEGDNLDIMVLQGGCTCCALRGDMVAALRELHRRRVEGVVPPFSRIVMETTGLADPAPVLFTLFADPALRHKFEAGAVIATFDAVHGDGQLLRYPESRKQIAVADRIVLTKTDLDAATAVPRLAALIRRINPAAVMLDARDTATPENILNDLRNDTLVPIDVYDSHKPEYGALDAYGDHKNRHGLSYRRDRPKANDGDLTYAAQLSADAEKLSARRPYIEQMIPQMTGGMLAEHAPHIDSVAIALDEPLEWSAFAVWLTLLLHAHGEKMLRFKALLHVAGWPGPVVLDGIHHMIHPPVHLPKWPAGPRVSRLVFIAQDMRIERIEPSLRAFLAGERLA